MQYQITPNQAKQEGIKPSLPNGETSVQGLVKDPATGLVQGKFISFEGTEGVGKTTAIDGLCERLQQYGIDFVRTREPGGSEFAELLRAKLLDNATQMHSDTELLTMFTARVDHLHKLILPALQAGKWVLCDRFVDSTVAYQGFGRYGGDGEQLDKIAYLSQNFVIRMPDLTFWLDMDIGAGLTRANKRSAKDRFETQTAVFFNQVYQGFLHQYERNLTRICRIDANQSKDNVVNALLDELNKKGLLSITEDF